MHIERWSYIPTFVPKERFASAVPARTLPTQSAADPKCCDPNTVALTHNYFTMSQQCHVRSRPDHLPPEPSRRAQPTIAAGAGVCASAMASAAHSEALKTRHHTIHDDRDALIRPEYIQRGDGSQQAELNWLLGPWRQQQWCEAGHRAAG